MKAGTVLEGLHYRENLMPAAAREGNTVKESAFLRGDDGGRPGVFKPVESNLGSPLKESGVTRLWIHPCDGLVTMLW